MSDTVILTPYFLDQYLPGLEKLTQASWILNKPDLPCSDVQVRMSMLHESLAKVVKGIINRGDRPVSIVGDCCATMGCMAGFQRTGLNPTLLWLDAHGDFNTWETTPSGFLGGMPLAMLVGRGEQRMPKAVGLTSVPEENVFLTDARDLDPGEKNLVESSRIHHLHQISDLKQISFPERPLYIHFDVDVLDPTQISAVSYPAPGGPKVEDLKHIFRHLSREWTIAGISMSTWNPDLDEDGRTRDLCMEVFEVLLDR